MAIQRLDALITLTLSGQGFQRRGGGATGYIKVAYLSHLVPHPEARWTVSPAMALEALVSQDFVDLTDALETEFRRTFVAQQVDSAHDRVLLVGLITAKI
jgi:GTP-binding protein HflX